MKICEALIINADGYCNYGYTPEEAAHGLKPEIVEYREIMGWGKFDGQDKAVFRYPDHAYSFVLAEADEAKMIAWVKND